VCPLPEAALKQGKDARRILPSQFRKDAEAHLQKTFGQEGEPAGRALEAFLADGFYLNQKWLKLQGVERSTAEEALAKWASEQPGIQAAYTRTELSKELPSEDDVGRRVQRGFYAERSGDVVVVVKPYCLITEFLTGTTHGSPHPYDTHVPLLVFGPGVRPCVRGDAVTPLAAAAILTHGLNVKPPAEAQVGVPDKLFEAP
jgi:hypothetical protein